MVFVTTPDTNVSPMYIAYRISGICNSLIVGMLPLSSGISWVQTMYQMLNDYNNHSSLYRHNSWRLRPQVAVSRHGTNPIWQILSPIARAYGVGCGYLLLQPYIFILMQ